jgi:hypothetical protein
VIDRLDPNDASRLINQDDRAVVRADQLTSALENPGQEWLQLGLPSDRLDDGFETLLSPLSETRAELR